MYCTDCEAKLSFMTSKKTDSNHFDHNLRLVYGMRSVGKGQAAAENCALLDLLPPPTKFHSYSYRLFSSLELVSKDSMTVVTRISGHDGNTGVTAAIDGTWQKRSHT